MSEWKGEFLGFTYGGIHSSDLGIVRVSDGSRFTENLLPTQQNRTVVVPGRDETYFFGSNDTQKQFNISYAFDSMTQAQLDQLRAHFADKSIRDLEFDERKGIIWKAKISASSIKFVPFELFGRDRYILPVKENWTYNILNFGYGVPTNSENFPKNSWYLDQNSLKLYWRTSGDFTLKSTTAALHAQDRGKNVYKGEGTLQLICYQPYGIEKVTMELNPTIQSNPIRINYGMAIKNTSSFFYDWTLKVKGFPLRVRFYNILPARAIILDVDGITNYAKSQNSEDSNDIGLFFESSTGLIRGLYEGIPGEYHISNKIYNQFIKNGDFFKIEPGIDDRFVVTSSIEWASKDAAQAAIDNETDTIKIIEATYTKFHY